MAFFHADIQYVRRFHPGNDGLIASTSKEGRCIVWQVTHGTNPLEAAVLLTVKLQSKSGTSTSELS